MPDQQTGKDSRVQRSQRGAQGDVVEPREITETKPAEADQPLRRSGYFPASSLRVLASARSMFSTELA